MKRVTKSGATTEEAIASALQQLGAAKEQVTVRVIAEGKKGFLGFGSRPAAVEVTMLEPDTEPGLRQKPVEEPASTEAAKQETPVIEPAKPERPDHDSAIEETETYIRNVAKEMGVDDLSIHTKRQGKNVLMRLESEKVALLIGKRGQTLNALQQLAQLVINKFAGQFLLVRLDAENYRERRQETLEQLADKMADKAVRTGHKVHMEPMPPHERKVIHQALSTRLDIETHSEGKEPKRYLVIKPLK
ncbi:RNA-binding cell elongation regulator Jag/EloR [Planococcus lenghuensis]|uniref:RNA-binding protein KhpB n=1 Tax=Planococcus lenghuensis TaxID=2213202 RepID=A0A1Q2L3C7_9BACL|nr:RNA-binding cell elongation regulator Jag/EloR [Planococcus lenghuensis]AQQ54931.1 protein jag [Planococcus lenghuensis]